MRILASIFAASLTAHAAEISYLQTKSEAPQIRSTAIKEASGIAVSTAHRDHLWVINDSGAKPILHLIKTDGSYCGAVTLAPAENVDWEDLASFSIDGKAYLLVADTGDNDARRESCTLYILPEPEFSTGSTSLDLTAHPAWEIQFHYEDGPHDCEAVAVDTAAGKVLLITKRTEPPALYELPLKPNAESPVLTARKIGTTHTPSPIGSLIPFRDQPTGLDITADHSLAAVITYYGIFLFPRKPSESWPLAFAKPPITLAPHLLAQAEALAFSKDGKSIYATSEGSHAKIIEYHLSSQ